MTAKPTSWRPHAPAPGPRPSRRCAALLAEREPPTVAMTDIAERAGVAATSLYRRWGDVRTLLTETGGGAG